MRTIREDGIAMRIGDHEFTYIQSLRPRLDKDGKIVKFMPQSRYANKKGLRLHKQGDGEFCRFELEKAERVSGVYAWVVRGENDPIYIGETSDFKKRFSTGYGNISPRNCFEGGQITNCKMNKVVLDHYNKGKIIDIYFLQTDDHKKIELELLKSINTLYNSKNN